MKNLLTNPRLLYKAYPLLSVSDWRKTGALLDVIACITFACLSLFSGWPIVISIVPVYACFRVMFYMACSPGRLSKRKIMIEVGLAALVAFLPTFASHSYAYAIQVVVYFPVFLVINLLFYLVAGFTPVAFAKREFYYFSIIFIFIGLGCVIFSVSTGLVSFNQWTNGNIVLYFALIIPFGSIVRSIAAILGNTVK